MLKAVTFNWFRTVCYHFVCFRRGWNFTLGLFFTTPAYLPNFPVITYRNLPRYICRSTVLGTDLETVHFDICPLLRSLFFPRVQIYKWRCKGKKTDTPSRSQWHESWSKALIEQHITSLQTPSKRFYRRGDWSLPGKNWIWQKMPLSTDNCHSFARAARS